MTTIQPLGDLTLEGGEVLPRLEVAFDDPRVFKQRDAPMADRKTVWLDFEEADEDPPALGRRLRNLGYADDALLVSLVLQRLVRRAPPDALARHWPGSAEGLDALRRVLRLTSAPR